MKDVFLDAASNTPLDRRVFKAMKPYMSEKFMGNSMSTHNFGIKAATVIEKERNKIAQIFHVPAKNIMFTSGATESNNLVIKGLAYKEIKNGLKRNHIICSAIEHDSVINACKQLEPLGFEIEYVYPRDDGKIHHEDVLPKMKTNTLLICVMAINNELGTYNDAARITYYASHRHIYSLVDCTQLVGYGGDSIVLQRLFPHASFFTFSGHKIYGPGGTGCLVATEDNLDELYQNGLIVGGAQEFGVRGGTVNVAGVVGLCTAIQLMFQERHLGAYYQELYNYLILKLNVDFNSSTYSLNAIPIHKNIISLNFGNYFSENIDSLAARLAIEGVAVSASSACDSEHDETAGDFNPSHVLVALGHLSEHDIRCTIRVSFNKHTTRRDIDRLVKALVDIRKGEDLLYD